MNQTSKVNLRNFLGFLCYNHLTSAISQFYFMRQMSEDMNQTSKVNLLGFKPEDWKTRLE